MANFTHNQYGSRAVLETAGGPVHYYRLAALEEAGLAAVSRLPFSIKILLETALRNWDDFLVTEKDILNLATWNPQAPAQVEIPFMTGRVIMQDFTGVPAVVDLAALRAAMARLGGDPQRINPLIPADLVIDHSVQVDNFATSTALLFNAEHPDPADPLHLFAVDDGDGYVDGDKRWRFIGAYLIYGQWKQAVVGGIQALSAAYVVTGQARYAHKAGVLLDRVADLYPNFDFRREGVMYEGPAHAGYVSTWHDACEEARELVLAYDRVFPAVSQDTELAAFLAEMSAQFGLENPKATPADLCRNIEERIGLDTLQNAGKITSNYPRQEITLALIRTVLQWPGNRAEVLAAIDEAIDIGRRSGVAVHISHLRVADPSNHGLAPAMLERIDRARAGGVDVTFDLYPYTWGCAPLLVVLPPWAQEGGPAPILERLGDPATVARMDAEMSAAGVDWSACNVSNLPPLPCGDWDGASLPQVAAALGLPPSRAVLRLLLESELDATFVAGGGSEEDNALLLAHPAAMIGSDGVLVGRHPHPRGYGCFPRVLARCVRESRLMSWEAAIAKMTALPAARFGLEDRGRLRASAAADLVVLSPERVADTATFEEGRRPPGGIEWVVLNGQVVVQNGTYTGGNYGRALRPLQSNWRHADASS